MDTLQNILIVDSYNSFLLRYLVNNWHFLSNHYSGFIERNYFVSKLDESYLILSRFNCSKLNKKKKTIFINKLYALIS